jgi:hypothetical protein
MRLSWHGLLAADMVQYGDLVELLGLQAGFLQPVRDGLALAELFQNPQLAVGFDQELPAALGFRLDLRNLGCKLSPLRR